MKKIICLILIVNLFIPAFVFADKPISVTLNGEKIIFDVEPALIKGRTMVPIRAIFEAMGATVVWDNNTQSAICTKGDTVVKMTIDSPTIYINNAESQMDTSPVIINGRTLAPARFVAEAFGYNVEWDDKNSIAKITSDNANAKKEEVSVTDDFVVDILDKSVGSFYIPYQSGLPEITLKYGAEFQPYYESEIVYIKLESNSYMVVNKSYSEYSGDAYDTFANIYDENYQWIKGTINLRANKTFNVGDLINLDNFYWEDGSKITVLYSKFESKSLGRVIKNASDVNFKAETDMSKVEAKAGDKIIVDFEILTDKTEKGYPVLRILYNGGNNAKYMHLIKGVPNYYRNTKYTEIKREPTKLNISKEECKTKIDEISNNIIQKKEELNIAFKEKDENKAIDVQNKINALGLELKKYVDYLKTLE